MAADRRVGRQPHSACIGAVDREARRLFVLERKQRIEPVEVLMLAADIGKDLRPVAFGVAKHALRPLAVAEPEIFEMLAAKAELDRAKPEIPVFETEPHALVEPGAFLEHGAPHQAARLADILFEVPEDRIGAGVVAVPLLPEHVDIRIDPAGFRMVREHVIGALQGTGQKAVVRVEEIDRVDRVPGAEDILDPGVARGAQPAIGTPDVMHTARCRRGEIETGLMGLGRRAAVIDDDDDAAEFGLLVEGRDHRFAEQHAVLVDRDDNSERRPDGAAGDRRQSGSPGSLGEPHAHGAAASSKASTTKSSQCAGAERAGSPLARRVAR